jgi:hypothetical protein
VGGANTASTPSLSHRARSASRLLGYPAKFSFEPNESGLTKIETTTGPPAAFAALMRASWPAWSAPIVGTSDKPPLPDLSREAVARICATKSIVSMG